MIGKTSWFTVRKWGGWGLTPATREGWLYVGGFVGLVAIAQLLTSNNPQLQTAVTGILVVILLVDVLDIMIHLKKDEREIAHEALAERNASWFMVFGLGAYIAYQAITSALNHQSYSDPALIAILLGGAATKALTYWRLREK